MTNKENICKDFGKRPAVPSRKCLSCDPETILECEIEKFCRKEKMFSKEQKAQARFTYTEQIRKNREDDSCYGNFGFEEIECWKECDFNLFCLLDSGIKCGKECRYFPPSINRNKKETCEKCIFYTQCFKEEEEAKIFKSFLSLGEIRNKLLVKE